MYFAESAQADLQDLGAQSLQFLQQYYSEDGVHYSVRHTLPIIAETFPKDEELSDYLQAFHPDGRIAGCLQLQSERPAVAATLANSLRDINAQEDSTIHQVHELAYIQDPRRQPLRKGIGFLTQSAPYDLTWPAWSYKKAIPMNHPCGTETWNKLRKSSPRHIGKTLIRLAQDANDNPDVVVAQAAVRLVCSKKTAPNIDGQTGHLAILTAPSRVPKVHKLLRLAGASYERGAMTVAGALARADEVTLWDEFHEQARTDLAAVPNASSENFEAHSLLQGVGMAMRAHRYDVAYDMAVRATSSSSTDETALRALTTIISRAHAEKA